MYIENDVTKERMGVHRSPKGRKRWCGLSRSDAACVDLSLPEISEEIATPRRLLALRRDRQ